MKTSESCSCKNPQVMIIDRRAASRITTILVLCSSLLFVTGYFIGKRHAVRHELAQYDSTLLNHQIQYNIDEQAHRNIDHETENRPSVPEHSDNNIPVIRHQADPEPCVAKQQYVAILAGYGTERAAQQFVQRLEKKDIKAEIKTRVSTNANNKKCTWYQVVTRPCDDKERVMAVVQQLKHQEHLGNDIRIVEYTNA